MHVAIHHPRHDELAGGIEHLHVAAPRGDRRSWANGRNAVTFDTDDAMTNDLTADRIEYGTADDLHLGHSKLLSLIRPRQTQHVLADVGQDEVVVDGRGFVQA